MIKMRLLKILVLSSILLILILAFGVQLLWHELPCPMCLLQRFGFLGMAFGFLLNLRFGPRPSHYAITLFSATFTAIVALQQIAYHVNPGSTGFGSPILNLHLYTWSFLLSGLTLVTTVLMLSVDKQYEISQINTVYLKSIINILFALTATLTFANLITVLLQCGISACPGDPTDYYFWNTVF